MNEKKQKKSYNSAKIEILKLLSDDILLQSSSDPNQGTWDPLFEESN